MILVDASVWIDYFRGISTDETEILSACLRHDEDLCLSGITLTEVLQGIRSEPEYRRVQDLFLSLIFLPMSKDAYLLAAEIYRCARKKGHTIRNTIDCLIAACAIVHSVPLLQCDKDFDTIVKFSRLKLTRFV